MNTEDLVKRLRAEGENAMRQNLSMGMHKLCSEAADALEAKDRRIINLEAELSAKCTTIDDLRSRLLDLEAQNERLYEELKRK